MPLAVADEARLFEALTGRNSWISEIFRPSLTNEFGDNDFTIKTSKFLRTSSLKTKNLKLFDVIYLTKKFHWFMSPESFVPKLALKHSIFMDIQERNGAIWFSNSKCMSINHSAFLYSSYFWLPIADAFRHPRKADIGKIYSFKEKFSSDH